MGPLSDAVPSGASAGAQAAVTSLALLSPKLVRGIGVRSGAGRAVAVSAIVASANVLVAVAERRWPHRASWNEAEHGEVVTDVTYLLAQAPVVAAVDGFLARWVLRRSGVDPAPASISWWSRFPLPVRLLGALALAEFPHYWWHRLGHGRGWAWHAVHHSPRRLYWLNATRFHLCDMVVDTFQLTVPLLLARVDADTMIAYTVFSGTFGKVQHANLGGRSGLIDRVLSTPDLHRVHHTPDRERSRVNFGARLSIWDQVFGTFRRGPDDIGVGPGDEAVPTTWLGQLLHPWSRRRRSGRLLYRRRFHGHA